MYKILLVDDEALIRDAVSEIIKWEDLGFTLAGSCKDGREAIAFIQESPPDLVITDICMPYVDGLELSRFVHENYPDTKVIIISGYDEFDYAKQAVKYQVLEYLLKPVTSMEFSEALKKVKENFDALEQKNKSIRKIRSAYVSNLPVLKGRFLNSLLHSVQDGSYISEKLEEYSLSLHGSHFSAVILEGDDFTPFISQAEDATGSLGQFAVFNIAEEIMARHRCGEAMQNLNNQTILIFSGDSPEALTSLTGQVCPEIRQSISLYLQIPVTISIGAAVYTLRKLPLSYENAKALLEYRFLSGGNQIFCSRDFVEKVPEFTINRMEWTDRILLAIKTGSTKDLAQLTENFTQAMRDSYLPKSKSILYIQNVVLSIMNQLEGTVLEDENIYQMEREFLNALYARNQLSDMQTLLHDFCCRIADALCSHRDSYGKKQALLALSYIDKNYGNSDVSLNSVCSHLAMSTSHFSSVFKNETGETFIEALTKKRIEKAKGLIESTSLKAYEIAEQVGYSDPHYFSIAFKKHTGTTPTEYAKSRRQPI